MPEWEDLSENDRTALWQTILDSCEYHYPTPGHEDGTLGLEEIETLVDRNLEATANFPAGQRPKEIPDSENDRTFTRIVQTDLDQADALKIWTKHHSAQIDQTICGKNRYRRPGDMAPFPSNDISDEQVIQDIRNYLAEHQPETFMPDWDQLSQKDKNACWDAAEYSINMNPETGLIDEEDIGLLVNQQLEGLIPRTDPEPLDPGPIMNAYRKQIHKECPPWAEIPTPMKLRFTDVYHHSESFRKHGTLNRFELYGILFASWVSED